MIDPGVPQDDRIAKSDMGVGWYAYGLLLCLGLTFAVRSLPYRNYIDSALGYYFNGPDPYDHLRRIVMGIHSFPKIPTYDYYYGFPVGTGQIWSPLFDYLLSVISIIGGGTQQVAEAIGFWFNPAMAIFSTLMVTCLATKLYSRKAGLVAGAILALLPGHITYSQVAKLDHHVIEPILCLAIMLSILKAGARSKGGTRWLPGWLLTGLLLVCSLLLWRGSIVFWGIALLSLTVQILAEWLNRRDPVPLAQYARNMSLVAAGLLVPVCLTNVLGTSDRISFGVISWFHVIFLAIAALLFLLAERLPGWNKRQVFIGLVASLLLVPVVLVNPTVRRFAMQFITGLSVIGGGDPWLDSIIELKPIFFLAGTVNLASPVTILSCIYLLLPLLLIQTLRTWRQGGYSSLTLSQFLIWGSVCMILPLFRVRYVHLAALFVAVGGGGIFHLLTERFRGKNLVAGGLIVLLLLPVGPYLAELPRKTADEFERRDLMGALQWIRHNTPPTSNFDTPVRPPEYGVLADWTYGAYILYIAERPVVSTNFGWETYGLYQAEAFLITSDPVTAERIARENKVRYLLLSNMNEDLQSHVAIAQKGVATKKIEAAGVVPFRPLNSMYYRLLYLDGARQSTQQGYAPALGIYRLLYESSGNLIDPRVGPVSYYKVFERVSGALLTGQGVPGAGVEIRLQLRCPTGRILIYSDSTVTDSTGVYTFRVPYATDQNSGALVPQGGYLVNSAGRQLTVAVPEAAVTAGAVVDAR